tara:strand:- start:6 stop:875 length:870 start_codon:yes stop_codon:yes gene_type:complete
LTLNKHIYQYDTIVIGGGLNAKVYAYYNKCPCVNGSVDAPFRFDMLEQGMPLFSTKNKLQTFEEITFLLGLSGQLPMGDKRCSINIRGDTLKVITSSSRIAMFEFNKLIIFDDANVFGLPPIKEKKVRKSRVLDWFDVRSGMEHDFDLLNTQDDFIKKVFFYPSDRFGSQKSARVRKDLVAVSYLEQDDVKDFEYSDTMARFKILQMMKDAGIKGARNGRDTNNPKLYRYYSPKIEATQRQIIPDVTKYYEEDPRFEFRYDTPEEIIKEFDKEPDSYASKLINLLTKTN